VSPNINNPQYRFEHLAVPGMWLHTADLLKESGDVLLRHGLELWESAGVKAGPGERVPLLSVDQSVVMYLYALAIENLVKGIIIARDPRKLRRGKLSWPRDGHRLRELFREADISFRDRYEEQLICKQFQGFLDWKGRYPIPKHKHALVKAPLFHVRFHSTGDFQSLYGPLRQTLLGEIHKGL
jgi:hypothetical protein